MAEKNECLALFHHLFSGLDRPTVFSALHQDPAVENDSCRVLFFLSASADRDLLMAGNGISRLLGDFRYFGCRLLHFDPAIVSDRPDLEYRRHRPIFPKKTNSKNCCGHADNWRSGSSSSFISCTSAVRSSSAWAAECSIFAPTESIFIRSPRWEAVKPPLLVPVLRDRLPGGLFNGQPVRFDPGEDRLDDVRGEAV